MKNKLFLIIPTLNEEENILRLTNKLLKIKKHIEILVVDDSKKGKNRPKNLNKKVNFINRKNGVGRCSAVLHGIKIGLKKRKIYLSKWMQIFLTTHMS